MNQSNNKFHYKSQNPDKLIQTIFSTMKYTLIKAIKNVTTGDWLDCTIEPVSVSDLYSIQKDFSFDWNKISKIENIHIVKLTIAGKNKIEGLMAYQYEPGFLEVVNIERRQYKVEKVYDSISKALFHYASKISFEVPANKGYISFNAKGSLIEYYKIEIGAKLIYKTRMAVDTVASKKLLSLYSSNETIL